MKKNTNETKLCKYCKTEIPKKAKVCPNCRKKQGGKLKWIVILIVVILLLAMLFGSSDDDTSQNQNTQEETNQTESSNNTFEVDGLEITLNDSDLKFTNYDDEYDMYTPAEGMKYISASFTFNNTSDSDKYVSIYDFTCYADNTTCEQVFLPDDSDFINTNLSSGRNVTFTTYYTVPKNAKSIELEYTENVWTDDKIMIKLK